MKITRISLHVSVVNMREQSAWHVRYFTPMLMPLLFLVFVRSARGWVAVGRSHSAGRLLTSVNMLLIYNNLRSRVCRQGSDDSRLLAALAGCFMLLPCTLCIGWLLQPVAMHPLYWLAATTSWYAPSVLAGCYNLLPCTLCIGCLLQPVVIHAPAALAGCNNLLPRTRCIGWLQQQVGRSQKQPGLHVATNLSPRKWFAYRNISTYKNWSFNYGCVKSIRSSNIYFKNSNSEI